ncbi:MAG: hypothetical protein DWB42_06920 [Chloroflexi bacterium]|nr:hypothetical protein [Chloroflexota bacterium]MDL1884530.1 hypothetical protein [Anaerolineae bacterium CFX8]
MNAEIIPVARRLALPHLAAYGFYLLAAVIVTWPLAAVFSTHFIGHPFGDSYEYARFVWWFKYALVSGEPLYFQPWLAYPDGLSAWLLWSIPLQSFPAWLFAFALPLPAAMNLSILLRLALNGWAMFVLVSRLVGARGPALLAGVIFLAYPTFQGQLAAGHTGLLALWPVPLYVHSLHSLAAGRRHSALSTIFFFVLSVLGSSQILIFLLLPVTALFALMLAARREWPALRRLLAAAGAGAGLSLIFIAPGFVEALNAPPWLRERGDVSFSADLLAIVSPSFQHPLFGRLDYPHAVLGVDPFEKTAYIGIIAWALALAGVWKRRETRGWLALAAAAWALSLGPLLKILDRPVTLVADGYPTYITLPWALYQQIPLLNIVRVPARFNFVVALAAAVLAGYGAAALRRQPANGARGLRRRGPGWAVWLALAAGVLWEYRLFWPDMPTLSADIPAAVAALAERPDVRAVFDAPWAHLLAAKDGLYLQTAHRKPLIAGQITRRTPVNPAKLAVLETTLDPALLDAAGVDVFILHKEWDEGRLEPFFREKLGAPFYEDARLALFNAPQAESAPAFTAVLASPSGITDRADSYFYTPERTGLVVRAAVAAEGRAAALYLDGQPLGRWPVYGAAEIAAGLTAEPGYHTLTLAVEPPCPVPPAPSLECRALRVDEIVLER